MPSIAKGKKIMIRKEREGGRKERKKEGREEGKRERKRESKKNNYECVRIS